LQAAVDAPRQLARQWLQSCGPSADSKLQRHAGDAGAVTRAAIARGRAHATATLRARRVPRARGVGGERERERRERRAGGLRGAGAA
jgi:hypothetical protein